MTGVSHLDANVKKLFGLKSQGKTVIRSLPPALYIISVSFTKSGDLLKQILVRGDQNMRISKNFDILEDSQLFKG